MNRHPIFLLLFSVMLLPGWNGCSLMGSGMDRDVSYDSYAEAEADGALRKGWVPEFVSSSAVDIRESHNLDTNEHWLTFRCNIEDLQEMKQKLKPVTSGKICFPRNRSTDKRSWWPEDLREHSDGLTVKYDFFSIGSKGFIGVEKDAPVVWYWSP